MKRATVTAIFLSVLMMASVAMAGTLDITRVAGYYFGSGGEFNITNSGLTTAYYDAKAIVNGGFESFCLEKDEYIMPPTHTSYFEDFKAWAGGKNTDNGDPISIGTAWLYSQFAQGLLTSTYYNYAPGSGRESSAGALQTAIWWLEEEDTSTPSGAALSLLNLAKGALALGNIEDLKANANGQYGVRVVNPYIGQTQYQSQLYYNPVPEPTSLLLLGIGLVGAAALGRKFKRA